MTHGSVRRAKFYPLLPETDVLIAEPATPHAAKDDGVGQHAGEHCRDAAQRIAMPGVGLLSQATISARTTMIGGGDSSSPTHRATRKRRGLGRANF
jgi:hypothetical protein